MSVPLRTRARRPSALARRSPRLHAFDLAAEIQHRSRRRVEGVGQRAGGAKTSRGWSAKARAEREPGFERDVQAAFRLILGLLRPRGDDPQPFRAPSSARTSQARRSPSRPRASLLLVLDLRAQDVHRVRHDPVDVRLGREHRRDVARVPHLGVSGVHLPLRVRAEVGASTRAARRAAGSTTRPKGAPTSDPSMRVTRTQSTASFAPAASRAASPLGGERESARAACSRPRARTAEPAERLDRRRATLLGGRGDAGDARRERAHVDAGETPRRARRGRSAREAV